MQNYATLTGVQVRFPTGWQISLPGAIHEDIPARVSAIVYIIVYVVSLAAIDTDTIIRRQGRDYRLSSRGDVAVSWTTVRCGGVLT